jgi:hypothetical protein
VANGLAEQQQLPKKRRVTMKADTNERYIPGDWMFMLTAFAKAIEKASQKKDGAFSQNLVNILNRNAKLKKKIREKRLFALKVANILGSGRQTIIEFINELFKETQNPGH